MKWWTELFTVWIEPYLSQNFDHLIKIPYFTWGKPKVTSRNNSTRWVTTKRCANKTKNLICILCLYFYIKSNFYVHLDCSCFEGHSYLPKQQYEQTGLKTINRLLIIECHLVYLSHILNPFVSQFPDRNIEYIYWSNF